MAYKQRTGIPAATQSVLTADPDFLRLIVERVVQAVLEAEMTAHLRAELYERSAKRREYRNGYKSRQLNTRGAQEAGHANITFVSGNIQEVMLDELDAVVGPYG